MAVVANICRGTLYERFAMANHLGEGKCADIMKAKNTERARKVAFMSIVSEIVYDRGCYMMTFVLRFCAMAPAHLSAGEAAGEFVCCLLIQMCSNIFSLLLVVYYQGITVDVHDIAKDVKGEAFYWWIGLMAGFLMYLRGIGNVWDSRIRE